MSAKIKIPAGFRRLRVAERIILGDMWDNGKQWVLSASRGMCVLSRNDRYIRRIPKKRKGKS